MKRIFPACGFGLLLMAMGAAAQSWRFGGHVYVLMKKPATWAAARAEAERMGGRLAKIESAAENAFLFERLKAAGIRTRAPDGGGAIYVWLGASDRLKEGVWRWTDGSRLAEGYANWGRGPAGSEPDDFRGMQDAMALGLTGWPSFRPGALGRAGEWNDLDEKDRLAFVVEFVDRPPQRH